MKVVPLLLGVSLKEKPGSFGAYLDGNTLYLPIKVYMCAQKQEWQNGAQFFLGALSSSQVFQDTFGWSVGECEQASNELGALLRECLPDIVLDPLKIEENLVSDTDKLVDDCVNRVFTKFVNELRLHVAKWKSNKTERKFPMKDFISLAKTFVSGADEDQLRTTVEKLAPEWNSVVEGDLVMITVESGKFGPHEEARSFGE